ncbi:MAG: hypothetical protein QM757_18275 [Paludibaculum sp.]
MKLRDGKNGLQPLVLSVYLSITLALSIARGAPPIEVSMTADRWQTKENAEFPKQSGLLPWLDAAEQRQRRPERCNV